MNEPQTQPWASLPERTKREAAPDMLAGKGWMFYGKIVERPSGAELRRWLPIPTLPPRLTNAEKRAAVIELLRRNWRMSDREAARLAGCTHPFVAKVRRERRS